MKVRYRTESGGESTAYLDDGDGDTRAGADKYTDEPLTVRWDGTNWAEVARASEHSEDRMRPDVARLSPGSVQLPPGAEDRYPPEVIASMNQGPARPDA